MARKKSHSHPAANGAMAVDAATKEKDVSMRSVSLDRSESLKALNSMLLKETVERREQINQLRSELDRLAGDADVLSLIEREVGSLVVSYGLSEIRAADLEWASTVRGMMDSERLAAGEAKRRMELVALEKAEIESSLLRALSERDSAVANLSESKREFKLQELAAKEEANRLTQILEERREELGVIKVEKASLEERLKSAEGALRTTDDQLVLAEAEKNQLLTALEQALSEKEKKQNAAAAMTVTLRQTEEKLAGLEDLVIDLKKQKEATAIALQEATEKTRQYEVWIRELENKKGLLEEEKASLNSACERLKAEIEELKLLTEEKKYLDSELQTTRAALESANSELDCVSQSFDETKKSLEGVISERDANRAHLTEKIKENEVITGELEMLRLVISSLDKEKGMLHSDFESFKANTTNELAALRSKLVSTEQEKTAVEELKAKQVEEIADLSSKVKNLLSRESDLQRHLENITELNNRLKGDVESAQNDLQLHRESVRSLKLQMEELTKNKEDTAREFQGVKAELDDLVSVCNSKGVQIDKLAAEKATLERELADTKAALVEMEGQTRSAKVNFDKALALLRSTSELVSAAEEGEGGIALARATDVEEQELEAEAQEFAKGLMAIRAAFEKGSEAKAQLSREIDLLQQATQNYKIGMWSWICPVASTVIAAASFAYAATGKGTR